eukprot:GSA120T00022298001.1
MPTRDEEIHLHREIRQTVANFQHQFVGTGPASSSSSSMFNIISGGGGSNSISAAQTGGQGLPVDSQQQQQQNYYSSTGRVRTSPKKNSSSTSSSSSSYKNAAMLQHLLSVEQNEEMKRDQEEAILSERLQDRQKQNYFEYGVKSVLERYMELGQKSMNLNNSLENNNADAAGGALPSINHAELLQSLQEEEQELRREIAAGEMEMEERQLKDRMKLIEMFAEQNRQAVEYEKMKRECEEMAKDLSLTLTSEQDVVDNHHQLQQDENYDLAYREQLQRQIAEDEKLLQSLQEEALHLSTEESQLEQSMFSAEQKKEEMQGLLLKRKALLEEKEELEQIREGYQSDLRHLQIDVPVLDHTGMTISLSGVTLHVPWRIAGVDATDHGEQQEGLQGEQQFHPGGGGGNWVTEEGYVKKTARRPGDREFEITQAKVLNHPEIQIRDLIEGEDLAGLCEKVRYRFFLQKETKI